MKHLKLLGLGAMLALLAGCQESPIEPPPVEADVMLGMVGSNPVVGSASGSAHARCDETGRNCTVGANPDGPWRTFSFNARLHADGSVAGQGQFNNRGSGLKLKMDITCLHFFGDDLNRAWMIGNITHSNNEDFRPVGLEVGFVVGDNGEGDGADPDQASGWGPGPADFIAQICTGVGPYDLDFFFDLFVGEAAGGNIQVRAPEAD